MRLPPTANRPLVSTRIEHTLENLKDEVDNHIPLKSACYSTLGDSGEAKSHASDEDDSDPERPRKKRAISVDGLQNTPPVSLPGPHALRWSDPDPYTSIPPTSQQTNDRVDIVKLIRESRLENAAKAGENDEVKENLDFIALGMIPEIELERNAPENALDIPSQRQTGRGSIGPVSRRSRIRWDYEIISFYNWVKPQDFENIVRRDLVERLKAAFHSRYTGIEIHIFGSFASGVHLSTADIDLVLLRIHIAVPDSIECVAHARVPIVKFVDSLTGISVDMSFDNNSGLIAAETFQVWKKQFPIMPIILSVVKFFLLIRGLHEVRSGGLGGFSTTCLVTSFLQHLPQQPTQPTLGSSLMDFFNFYGDKFRFDQVAICLNPPGYFSKKSFGNPNRLTIEDPNDTYNDISSGAKATDLIFRTFAGAHTTLKNCLESLTSVQSPNKSILGSIIAANFDRYTEQRNQLHPVFMTEERFAKHRMSPSPPSESWHVSGVRSAPRPLPVGPPNRRFPVIPVQRPRNDATSKSKYTRAESEDNPDEHLSETKLVKPRRGQRGPQARGWRAARMKRLRPDLQNLPSSLTVKQALQHGGYATNGEMKRDLNSRERKQAAA
ncbi:PAP/25A-associated [Penicillium verhagenii]|uniref:PAP/25A-associated n=1 Tax=Penicillium verhagenii TaxID=1562060 RepID=UPI0025452C10|nr:PAP/25A-associated [Penicillium verhagenii]KAJ5938476.1 PAP/25A-associated [Penicillium verhagenii]